MGKKAYWDLKREEGPVCDNPKKTVRKQLGPQIASKENCVEMWHFAGWKSDQILIIYI